MAEATGAFEAVAGAAINLAVSRDAGGSYSISLSCEKSIVHALCVTGITLCGIYTAHSLIARAIDGILNRGLGGPRMDQIVGETRTASLHVKLHCLTDERFLEVWSDFESEKMSARLQEEFTQAGIEVVGLKVEIENMQEVNDTRRAIESRRCLSSQNSLDLKEEGDIKNGENKMVKDMVKDVSRQLTEVRINQERVEYSIKSSLEDLKREVIDEIRESAKTPQESFKSFQFTRSLAEVFLIGGKDKADARLDSVEKIQLGREDSAWSPLASLNVPRSHAASVVIESNIIVVGGGTDTIETLDVGQRPLQWTISNAVLPFSVFSHSCVVYNGKLLVIGGYNGSKGDYSNEIHEVPLVPPYLSKRLCTLPKPIGYHATEVVNDKIYIFGGQDEKQLSKDVLLFDPVTNECEKISELPYPLRYMCSVQVEDKVVLLGGERGDGIPLKEVIMFDPMTGKCSDLPPMNHARKGAAATLAGYIIVVMGGNGSKKRLRSVECFDLGTKTWENQPSSMKKARAYMTAAYV